MASRWSGRVIFGALLVLVGVVLLVDSTNVYEIGDLWTYAPIALVVWGVWRLLTSRGRQLFWPGTLILVGGGWVLVNLDVLAADVARSYWPVVIVLWGVSILTRRVRQRQPERRGKVYVFGDSVTHGDIEDGNVVAIFGDTVVDYRTEPITPPVSVDAVAIFGEAVIRVPSEWSVAQESIAVFGSVEDDRGTTTDGTPDLTVDGVALFGTIRITE